MNRRALIRRTRLLAALWLLALVAMAGADRAQQSCPLSSKQCSSHESDGECSFDYLTFATLPLRSAQLPMTGAPGLHRTVQLPESSVETDDDAHPGSSRAFASHDILALAPKTSPPFVA